MRRLKGDEGVGDEIIFEAGDIEELKPGFETAVDGRLQENYDYRRLPLYIKKMFAPEHEQQKIKIKEQEERLERGAALKKIIGPADQIWFPADNYNRFDKEGQRMIRDGFTPVMRGRELGWEKPDGAVKRPWGGGKKSKSKKTRKHKKRF